MDEKELMTEAERVAQTLMVKALSGSSDAYVLRFMARLLGDNDYRNTPFNRFIVGRLEAIAARLETGEAPMKQGESMP